MNKSDCIERAEDLIIGTEEFLRRYIQDVRETTEAAGLPYREKDHPIWIYEYKMRLAELYLMRAQLEAEPE